MLNISSIQNRYYTGNIYGNKANNLSHDITPQKRNLELSSTCLSSYNNSFGCSKKVIHYTQEEKINIINGVNSNRKHPFSEREKNLFIQMDDVQFNKAKQCLQAPLIKEEFNCWDIINLSKLNDESFSNIKKRNLFTFTPYGTNDQISGNICVLASLSDNEFHNMDKRNLYKLMPEGRNRRFAISEAANFAELSDEEYANIERRNLFTLIPKVKKRQLYPPEIVSLAKLPDDKYKASEKYLSLSATDIKKVPSFIDIEFFIKQMPQDVKIEDFSNLEKRDFLNLLQKTNYIPKEIQKIINSPLLPETKEEYCLLLERLNELILRDINEWEDKTKQQFYNVLNTFERDDNQALSMDEVNLLCDLRGKETFDDSYIESIKRIVKKPHYNELNDKDKNLVKIICILIDSSLNEDDNAFNAYYSLKKLGLDEDEKLKVYSIIKSKNWLEEYNNSDNKEKAAQNIAFEFRKSNCFKVAKLLTEKPTNGHIEAACKKIQSCIDEIQSNAIMLPQTKLPAASNLNTNIDNNVREVITFDKEGNKIKNTVIYLTHNLDLYPYGFEKGFNSDNINILVHGLESCYESSLFQTFEQVDSNALLSTSYINYGTNNNHVVFRPNGYILNVDCDDIGVFFHKNSGSGSKKDIKELKTIYYFNSNYDRHYVADLYKKYFNLSNKEFRLFYEKYKNMPLEQIIELNSHFEEKFNSLSKKIKGEYYSDGKPYNEVLVVRPKIQGVYTHEQDINNLPDCMRKTAQHKNVPIIVFRD